MATQTDTSTEARAGSAPTLTLEAPAALQSVQPEQAAGLVPLKEDQRDALEDRVDVFVRELVALDQNSPDFGKKVDQLTTMGRKEIAEAAGHSNRFLDRPVKAINSDTGIGADLTELRRTVEALDPAQGNLSRPRRLFGFIPFGNKMRGYFMKYQSAQT
ncbi:MAG: toxic anion resistance protein, partial [Allosphingosinicella sp.]